MSDIKLIEDFESRPHKAATFVVERAKTAEVASGNRSLFLGFGGERQNRTARWLIPSAVSLRSAGVEQLDQEKRMIGGIGNMLFSIYSQT